MGALQSINQEEIEYHNDGSFTIYSQQIPNGVDDKGWELAYRKERGCFKTSKLYWCKHFE